MSKKMMSAIIVAMLIIGIVSLYSTFAYDEETAALDESTADYDLVYSLKEKSSQTLIVNSKEEKYIDITLKNTYDATVRYGMYYYLISPSEMPEGVIVTLSDESIDLLENTIKSGQTRTISIKVTNNSDYNIELLVGALVGFEHGKIEDLVKDDEVLIK